MYYFLLLLSTMAVSFEIVFWGGLYGFILFWFGLFGCFTTTTLIIKKWLRKYIYDLVMALYKAIKEVKDDKNQTLQHKRAAIHGRH
jgi:hypothetical protein